MVKNKYTFVLHVWHDERCVYVILLATIVNHKLCIAYKILMHMSQSREKHLKSLAVRNDGYRSRVMYRITLGTDRLNESMILPGTSVSFKSLNLKNRNQPQS